MKKSLVLVLLITILVNIPTFSIDAWIRINQLGYLPGEEKKAVLLSETPRTIKKFQLLDALTYEIAAEYQSVKEWGKFDPFENTWILDFSDFNKPGAYFIKVEDVYSPTILINKNVYVGTADYLLNFLRSQHGKEEKTDSDKLQQIAGGWHYGSDLIKNEAITAHSIYQLLFAYQQFPSAFDDKYDTDGQPIPNGIPDILDEARWGLDWLLKVYDEAYKKEEKEFTAPVCPRKILAFIDSTGDSVFLYPEYETEPEIEVEEVLPNASIAGKYASSFALGALVLHKFFPELSIALEEKAIEIYQTGKENPGISSSIILTDNSSSLFQEENWTDDMELAAMQLFRLTFDHKYIKDAANYGRLEPVTPWLCSDTASYYQWYPFINMGHYMLGTLENPRYKKEFTENLRMGLQRMKLRGEENPFMIGVPMIRSSNNFVVSLINQCILYRDLTNDNQFMDMEQALVGWLFGRNPWGISMIVNMPVRDELLPTQFYSDLYSFKPEGAVIAGAVNKSTMDNLPYYGNETYRRFQSDWAMFHNDPYNPITNETAIDRTAGLTLLLAEKQVSGVKNKTSDKNVYTDGGITRSNPANKYVSLIFTGHNYSDGYEFIRKTLKEQNIKATFFFTGDFYRNSNFKKTIKGLQQDGHSFGAHSDKNTPYCAGENNSHLLFTKEEFIHDLQQNFAAMKKMNVKKENVHFLLPPLQRYNDKISEWCEELGLKLISPTPGTMTLTDNTIPEMRENYYSSQEIMNDILNTEEENTLNGYILLFNIGVDERRDDKFYYRLNELIHELREKGYEFADLYQSTDTF